MRKLKVCFVIHSLQAGGMERVMSELVNYFAQQERYEVHLVLYGLKRDIFYRVDECVQVHRPAFPFNNQWRTWSTLRTMWFLRRTLVRLAPDSILSFGERWNNLVLMSTLGTGLPVYVSDRAQPDKPLGFKDDTLRKWLYPTAKGVIAQTQHARLIFETFYKHSNRTVIGNPIRQIPTQIVERRKDILMVGRLIQSKQQDVLIRIFAQLNAPDWRLVLIGYDHLKQENQHQWMQLAQDLGVADRVWFAGKRDDVDDFYRQSEIFAFSSRSEGFPNVVGEAMSGGLPVVSFDCVAGPRDLIQEGINGFLIPLDNEAVFVKRLQQLIDDVELRQRMGKASQELIKRFDLTYICKQFEHFILPNLTST